MHFSKFFEDDEDYNIIECDKLDNNILIVKQKLDENQFNVVKLKEYQTAMLLEKGQVCDIINEEGIYSITLGEIDYLEDFSDYQIKNCEDNLCIIFFNLNIITNNKFYIPKNHKNMFYGEGGFDFKIKNPLKLFNKVIELRKYYSKEELLEQIRERISKIMISGIKQSGDEYIINNEFIEIQLNVFEEYGIKITSCDIENIEFKKK